MEKILVLRGGALGDFLVTLPALALLRERWPAARIELVGNRPAATLGVTARLLDAVHSQHDARWAPLFRPPHESLPEPLAGWLESFDLVVNFWPDPDSTLAARFPRRPPQLFISADATPARGPAAAHFCAPLSRLGLTARSLHYRFEPTATASAVLSDELLPIALHPGSGSARKNWPAERWLQLIDQLPGPLLLVVGEVEWEQWQPRWAKLDPKRVSVADRLPLASLVDALGRCRHFVGHDSGVSHLAAACGLPSTLLFGPTDPAIWAPPAQRVQVIQRGPELATIAVDEVSAALVRALAVRE